MFGFDPIAFWIVVTGVLVNCTGALLGNYLVLRRMSLLGDAISHAVLPGLAIAFVVTQTRSPLPMLIGALAAGVATIVLTELIHTRVKVPEDSAMGVVFTTLFAIGVVIISKVAAQVDLDPGCVLYGILETAALDTVDIGALEIPRITITMFAAFSAVVAFILLLWKELKIVAFDPALATTLGIPARLVHYALMMMVAGFCVAAFEAVGSILVVAMLIVPPAAAYLCTDRLSFMVVISAVIAAASAFFGRLAAFHLGTSVAAMMAVAAGGFFVLAFFAAPRHGLAARAWYKMRVGMRVLREDILALLFRWEETPHRRDLTRREVFAAVGAGPIPRALVWDGLRRGLLRGQGEAIALTAAGRELGRRVVRGHRLWETYLAKHFPLPEDHLHEPAHRMEHFLDRDMRAQIEAEVEHPATDPHGRPMIPRGQPKED